MAARNEPYKTAFEIIIDEWGTMSSERRLPTMGVLLEYLIDIEAIRAASYLSMDVLGGTVTIRIFRESDVSTRLPFLSS